MAHELPYGGAWRLLRSLDRLICDRIEDYFSYYGLLPTPDRPIVSPFAGRHLSDAVLAHIVEWLETEPDTDLHDAAMAFGLPFTLVERELIEYQRRYRHYLN